ncbi:MAG: hypothetical protein IT370_20080 [Deltaproteobacteria bacterium]|nr:hypothetical protein [Deltaproteobacteria bacterium]
MAPTAQKLLAEALALPADERAELIESLVRSLDEGDQLDDPDRARLHDALHRSEQQFRDGEGIPAEVVLDRLRQR